MILPISPLPQAPLWLSVLLLPAHSLKVGNLQLFKSLLITTKLLLIIRSQNCHSSLCDCLASSQAPVGTPMGKAIFF